MGQKRWPYINLKGDVDLRHYNYQSEEDLKRIYDKVMLDVEMKSV
jgi:hypothetical protein